MFQPNALYFTDAYKVGHKRMLAPGITRLYGTSIPRTLKYGPKGAKKIVSFGQQMTWRFIHDLFQHSFFKAPKEDAVQFINDMSLMLGMKYDGAHFLKLHDLGYLPIRVHSLTEGIETAPNVPHCDFINTVAGYAWLTLYLETLFSALSWKPAVAATIAMVYKRNCIEWVMKTDPERYWLIPYLCHDFSARGLNPHDMISVGLGHATSFRGSDTLLAIPAARYYYGEPLDEVIINSVNASEHSVSTTKIFTVGEKQMLTDWLKEFPNGILSVVADTFDLWKLLLECLTDPEVKALVMARDGKLVIRPDSGDPVDIVCGHPYSGNMARDEYNSVMGGKLSWSEAQYKGVVEILGDIFGYTTNEQGYKILDPHIGAIYGDSINLERQIAMYERLAAKGWAATKVVLGIGSFTYAFNTRDTIGIAIKGAWFEAEGLGYNIYKDPITDDGSKKSLKGFQFVYRDGDEYTVVSEVSEDKHNDESNELHLIYMNGTFYNQTTFKQIRERLELLVCDNSQTEKLK